MYDGTKDYMRKLKILGVILQNPIDCGPNLHMVTSCWMSVSHFTRCKTKLSHDGQIVGLKV
jgi:hypothetical protein